MGVKNNPPGAESGTQVIATRRLDRHPFKRRIFKLLMEGQTDEQVATQFGVHETSILRFRDRHKDEIAELVARFEAETADYPIAAKVNRVADYDQLREMLNAEIAETGVTWDEATRYGTKRRVSGAVDALLRTNQQAALELDQLPRAGITVNNQNVVIVKTVATTTGKPHPELD